MATLPSHVYFVFFIHQIHLGLAEVKSEREVFTFINEYLLLFNIPLRPLSIFVVK